MTELRTIDNIDLIIHQIKNKCFQKKEKWQKRDTIWQLRFQLPCYHYDVNDVPTVTVCKHNVLGFFLG